MNIPKQPTIPNMPEHDHSKTTLKPVSKILQEVADDICSHYCKYPEIWDEEKEGCELCESEICKNCPLSRLG